jgi:signal transduction histidine kinase/CheY-like chemotaxis protein
MFFKGKNEKDIRDDMILMTRIVELTPISIVVTAMDGKINYSNIYAQKVLKYSRERLQGTNFSEYFSGSGGETDWKELNDVVVRDGSCNKRVSMTCSNGDDIICFLNIFYIANNTLLPEVLVWVFRDTTEEILTAEEIEKKNREMAKMNSELIRWNEELKRVSELKSNFLSIASHELKTPLTSIKGYSDIIIDTMKDKLDSGIYRMIESINRAADRLHRVVNNILDVTRIEQKKLRLKPEKLDMSAVIRECIDELSHFATTRNIKFECLFDEGLPAFLGDKMRIQQVFTNLFSNALKYSPDNSIIQIKLSKNDREQFHIIIKDFGIGIDKSEQKKIFDPFYEVGNTNRHSSDFSKFMGGGTGLGLSIVKGVVERHGGRIWVESDGTISDKKFPGSEFHIIIPIEAKIDWDDDETKGAVVENEESESVKFTTDSESVDKKPTILFIDSDREAVEIARMVLENAFDVLVAETGEEGLLLSFNNKPSIILLDSYLPGIDGYRICKILRSQEDTKDIPIAFFSAGTQNDEIRKCFTSGADDFIVKPFDGKEIVNKIWRLLMKKKERLNFK